MKKQNKLLAFLLVFALLFSLMGNVAIATAPDEQILQTQEVASPTNISTPTNIVAANPLDTDHVYITIQTDNGVAVGRSGDDILEYPIYVNDGDITASDLLFRVHENEFHEINGKKGGNVTNNGSAFTWVWGKTFEDGVSLMEAGKATAVAPDNILTAGKSYYINLGSGKTSYIEAKDYHIVTGQSLEFTAKYWDGGNLENMNGDVYVGETIAAAKKVTTAVDGAFAVNFSKEGKFYVIVKQNGVKDAICSVIANAEPVSAPYNTFKKANALLQGDLYVVVTEYEGKNYAFAYDGGIVPKEVTVEGDTLVTDDDTLKWYAKPNDTFQTYLSENKDSKVFVYAGSQGLFTFSTGRKFTYVNGHIKLHDMGFDLTFDGKKFSHTNDPTNKGTVCEVTLYSVDLPGNYENVGFLPDGTCHEPEARTTAQKSASGKYTLAFVSDTHHALDYKEINLQKWLEAVERENNIEYIDAMGFCGDMGSAYSSTNEIYWKNVGSMTTEEGQVDSVLKYMDTYQDRGRGAANGKIGTVIYTFGNHEWYPQAGGDFMHHYGVNETNYSTGENGDNEVIDRFYRVGKAMETDKYVIYCLGSGGISAQLTSGYSDEDIDSLDNFLASAPTNKPIFILVHFPIHIWGDRLAGNAGKVVETINKYDDKNVVVLWGHNHSDWDESYDSVCRPGSKIYIDQSGIPVEINFTYLSAGCISDSEYSGADGGSAWVQGKGVVITFDDSWSSTNNNADITFTYYTMDGKAIEEGGPYLVSFRDGVYYEKLHQEYVEPGAGVKNIPTAPARVNHTFDNWYNTVNSKEVVADLTNITRHSLITGKYTYNSGLDKSNVYFTVVDETGKVVTGKDGKKILMYPIPYTDGLTVLDAVKALHEAEYDYKESETVDSVYAHADQHGALTWVWGYAPNNGSWVFGPGSSNGYVAATGNVEAGESYYIALYHATDTYQDDNKTLKEKGDYLATSYLAPYISNIKAGESLDFITNYWSFNPSNYKYTQDNFNGNVYIGTSLDDLSKTETVVEDGKFTMEFDTAGSYYVVVKDDSDTKGVADAACIVNVSRRNVIINDDTTTNTSNEGSSSSGGGSGTTDNNTPAQTTAPAAAETVKVEAKADASGTAKATVETKTVSDAVKNAAEKNADSIVIAPEVTGDAKEVKVELPKTAVNEVANGTSAALVVETDKGALELPNDTLGEITEQAGGANVEIAIAEKSVEDAGVKEAIAEKIGDADTANAAVAEITVSSGNEKITSFGGKTINAKVSVDGKRGFIEGRKYLALVISANGKRELLAGKCVADASGKLSVGVKVKHLSTFVVLDKELKSFADADAHWSADAVDFAVANGLMNGTSDTSFAPNSTLNRAMLVTILYRLAGSPAVAEAAKFADVAAGEWYTDAVAWAAANGIVTGKTETSFAPMENITREQFATMLMRYCKFAGIDTASSANLGAFADSAAISAYAKDALAWANASGIITGRTATTIAPTGSATRGEAATMLMRFMQM